MRGLVVAYRRVFSNGPLTRLMAGEFVSSIGDWVYLVALLALVYEATGGDPVLLGAVGAIRILPYVFLSVPAGILADRVDRRLILIVTDVGRAAIMGLLALLALTDADATLLIALTLAATCLSAFFGPAIGSYLPSLVKDEADLGPANSVYASLDTLALVIGPAIGGLVLGLSGSFVVAFALNAASFVFVSLILWRLPASRAARPGEVAPAAAAAAEGEGDPGAELEGATEPEPAPEPFRWSSIRVPLAGILLYDMVESFVFGMMGVLTVYIAYEIFAPGDVAAGDNILAALNSAVGIGGLVGAVLAGILVTRRRVAPPLLIGFGMTGIALALLGTGGAVPIAMLAMAATSLGSLLTSVVGGTLFQRMVPDHARGRAIGSLGTVIMLIYTAGAFLGPSLAATFGLEIVLFGAAAAVFGAGIVAVLLLGPWGTQPVPPDPDRERLAALPILAGLPPARIEAALSRAKVVKVRAGQVIIRQGDVADRFYVLAEGEVEVTQVPAEGGAARVLRRMGAGESFGEIGLLAGSPRTATVTAVADGRLVALRKDDFLALVGGAGITFPFLEAHRGGGIAPGS